MADEDEDDLDSEQQQSGIQTPAEDTRANLDDEWPEEDVKPKGKKGKKAKAQKAVEEYDDEEMPAEPAVAVAAPATPIAAEVKPEANDADEDAGPKVSTSSVASKTHNADSA